ncbi:MAG: hypothetical protein GXN98_04590 [Euryarchaeota archaeon]|nr:hypothetical protein [Euryarchaeota archaeon]
MRQRVYPLLGFRAGFEELAKIGDGIVNLSYSLALSRATGRVAGRKVPNAVLARAVQLAGLRGYADRGTRHSLGDFAESIIAEAVLLRRLSLEECVEVLERGLRQGSEAEAFAALLRRSWEAVRGG